MKRTLGLFLPPTLVLAGLTLCCLILWCQTTRFRNSVENIAEDVRVSLIDMDGKVAYDSTGQDLTNHSDRAEFDAVRKDGKARSVVRESETRHMAMFYHARRVGNYVLRIAVPYQSVTDAKTYAQYGLLAAIAAGALVVLAIFFFVHKYERHIARLASERDLQDKLLDELRKLEQFRRDFISNVTHEIKTPVTGILGAIEILANETSALDAQDRADLQKVLKDQSVRLNALVEDILSLARLEKAEADRATNFIPCNVTDVVHTAVNLARPQAAKAGVEIRLTSQPSHPFIRPCDSRLLESAISNLIQNALRYSGSKDIEVEVKGTPDGKTVISVRDHGIGISADCLPRLFERFYRVDKNRSRTLGGTGLGLAIVKHIAQLHGGEVSVQSAPGKGSTFTLALPEPKTAVGFSRTV